MYVIFIPGNMSPPKNEKWTNVRKEEGARINKWRAQNSLILKIIRQYHYQNLLFVTYDLRENQKLESQKPSKLHEWCLF